ncbi:MAG: urease accessory protein UreE, partial [Pseudomonadota bacterium]
ADQSLRSSATVTLPIEKRIKSRLRVDLDDGREAGIVLTRGEVLQHGDKLQSEQGDVVEVIAASETLSVIRCHDNHSFARACYHLGNRHVPVEIVTEADLAGKVSYLHDHVLDDMIKGFGLEVSIEQAPFNPEPGAYGGGHVHGHSH